MTGGENISERITQNAEFVVSSINDFGRIIRAKIKNVVYGGKKECFLVVADSGEEIVCSADHCFCTDADYGAYTELRKTIGWRPNIYSQRYSF